MRTVLLLETESGLPAHPKTVIASPGVVWLNKVKFNFETTSSNLLFLLISLINEITCFILVKEFKSSVLMAKVWQRTKFSPDSEASEHRFLSLTHHITRSY